MSIVRSFAHDAVRTLGVALLGTCLATAALAQQLAPEQQAPSPQPVADEAHLTDTEADLAAFLNARIAALKTVLGLTADQERLWVPVEREIRASAAKARARADARYSQPGPTDFLQALEGIAAAEEERGASIRALVAAFRPLAAELTPEQMRRAPPFLGMIDDPWGEQPSAQLWIFQE